MSEDFPASHDELLSVNDVARLWETGLTAVVQSIESGQLLSLDRGLLMREGRYDVPLIRRSWAESLQRDSPGASRTLDPPPGQPFHPAVETAFDFHKALDLGDAQGVFATSSEGSRAGRLPEDLLAAWQTAGSHLVQPNAGVGTTIYALTPLDAVAARVMADAPTLPRAVTKPTPATMIDALPLVSEDDGWRVDLPLFERRDEWSHLLTSPLPGSDGSPEPSGSSSSAD
ncbi:MAG: hypothetical protein ACRDLD_00745 [Thermoleophilaceae bacterium]